MKENTHDTHTQLGHRIGGAARGDRRDAGARVDVTDTRLLSQPAISGTHVAFVYAGDLWIARLDGNDVRRLTTDTGRSRVRRSRPTAS